MSTEARYGETEYRNAAGEAGQESHFELSFDAMKREKDHPLRMKVLWDEIFLAEEIKAKLRERPELDLPSDFVCVQLALTCNGDSDLALDRVQALQDFRKLYGFVESSQDGCRAIRRLLDIIPESVLSFHHNPADGNYLIVKDLSKMNTSSINPSTIRDFLVGMYYLMQAAHPDCHCMHKGLTAMVDCMGMDWTNRSALKLFNRFTKELPPIYPHNVSSVSHYNTPAVFNVIARAGKKILPEEVGKKLLFGLKYPAGLASIYIVPDAATAQQRVIQQLEENLRRRYDNEKRFSLARSNCEAITPSNDDEVETVTEARGFPF